MFCLVVHGRLKIFSRVRPVVNFCSR